MKVEETFIGEFPEDDFRSKGLVIEAETEYDAAYIDYFTKNPRELKKLIFDSGFVRQGLSPKERFSPKGLKMSVNGRDWVKYDREIHSQMSALGFEIEIRNDEE